jgi:hypothetical protein
VESIIALKKSFEMVLTHHESSTAEDASKADERLSLRLVMSKGIVCKPQFCDLMASSLRPGESFWRLSSQQVFVSF